jgi:hypothetical protein
MAFGDAQATSSLRLIEKYGQEVTFSRNNGAYDPVAGKKASKRISWLGKALRLSVYKGIRFEGMDEAFKKGLATGKAICAIVAAKGLEYPLEPGDVVSLADESTWTIIGLTVLNPAGVPIIHTIGAVKA